MVCNREAPIDLHIHSTASDGTLAPHQILKQARALGLGAIAITDHDTTQGAAEALNAGVPPDLHLLAGVEISTEPPPGFGLQGSLHILGYGFVLNDPVLAAELRRLQRARRERNPRILARLRTLGVALDMKTVAETGSGGQLGRPHIAAGMVAAGSVPDIGSAFDLFLAKGRPAYVDKYRIPYERAIEIIRAAGGIAVMAHPGLLALGPGRRFDRLVALLQAAGLEGIEAYYSEHSQEQSDDYRTIARRYDLLVTGGSDFHGDITPTVRMGSGCGDLCVPFHLYEALAARVRRRRPESRADKSFRTGAA